MLQWHSYICDKHICYNINHCKASNNLSYICFTFYLYRSIKKKKKKTTNPFRKLYKNNK